jgi:hypothetical protein
MSFRLRASFGLLVVAHSATQIRARLNEPSHSFAKNSGDNNQTRNAGRSAPLFPSVIIQETTTMSKSTELLNKVQRFIINFANESGISLHEHFKSIDQFKQFVIAITFRTLTEAGVSTEDAFNAVCGDGAFKRLADDLWETLQPAEHASR